jgi:hypothetical protein
MPCGTRANVGVMRSKSRSQGRRRIVDFEKRLNTLRDVRLVIIAKNRYGVYNKNAIKASKKILKERNIKY